MRIKNPRFILLIFSVSGLLFIAFLLTSFIKKDRGGNKWTIISKDSSGIVFIKNNNGSTLAYSTSSGITILTIYGLAFKDLNKNGKLDKYEDWRLPVNQRAKDLASKLSIEQIAGLMLYSGHQAIPGKAGANGTSNL